MGEVAQGSVGGERVALPGCGPGRSTRAGQVSTTSINRHVHGRSGPGRAWPGSSSAVVAGELAGHVTSFEALEHRAGISPMRR